jgi:hypothetical protein
MRYTKQTFYDLIYNKFNITDFSNIDVILSHNSRSTKIVYNCKEHGESYIYWGSLTGNNKTLGCKSCIYINKRTEEFKDILLKQNHLLLSEYMNANHLVTLKCLIHDHTYQTTRNDFLNCGRECKHCLKEKNISKWKEIFISKSKSIHDNYYIYDYVEYKTVMDKVKIICPEHGEFFQAPDSHMSGQKCIKCAMSYSEKSIKSILDEMGFEYEYGKGLKILTNPKTGYPLKPDFYLEKYNLVIEYDGIQHFKEIYPGELKKIQKLDSLKNKLCEENSINIWRFNKSNVHLLKDKLIKLKS